MRESFQNDPGWYTMCDGGQLNQGIGEEVPCQRIRLKRSTPKLAGQTIGDGRVVHASLATWVGQRV